MLIWHQNNPYEVDIRCHRNKKVCSLRDTVGSRRARTQAEEPMRSEGLPEDFALEKQNSDLSEKKTWLTNGQEV